MSGTGKDGAEYDPEIRGCAELCAHDGAEDRTYACNVKELDQVNLAGSHRDVVDAVLLGVAWGLVRRVCAEHVAHKPAIEHIAQHEGQ